ncbi:translation initiation factor IF-2 [Candidatus Woesearchaeota archaeon]|jgi:translation initiation factor 5B|nr:translation initiation factor IF-2 [Candidatus Woesearchaeota archaeon]MBT3537081.1 translation initiation factor IF-2 [Candidatus Woesearchaeota archaeon]MBT4717001.1 translation initiation factor IF-2 [Candidatus Woesearchaeota archaeon]MBT7106609.1 translation initiation factor IF-2 [Candidatus Woesearchaeota archaeon]MBT7931827.1 translation initiation factor IF-2 [Candidatus Woesearchaeota archaeon]
MTKQDGVNQAVRSPVCTVVGHVDHGKSSVLDSIRDSKIIASEAGGITQSIGASIIPLDVVKKKCGRLLDAMKINFTIPGLLFIDTPGHAAFTNLRKRGGSLADIAVLVVDLTEGFMPQTIEAVEILKTYKTPFIIAANKIDTIGNWRSNEGSVLANFAKQTPEVQTAFETKMYELVGTMHEKFALNAERFDRVDDFTTQVAIVPCSAKTGEGIPELLTMLTGLAQKFLEKNLALNADGCAKGTILEVKDERGIGTSLDVIIYDGTLNVNDTIVIGGMNEPIVTKVRALFEPDPLAEMRDKKAKFKSVKSIVAAMGVKIAAPGLDGVVAGMPVRSCSKDEVVALKKEIQKEVDEVIVETDDDGIIIKADTLGSLEALTVLLREAGYKIRKASVGHISKKDISEAESVYEKDPFSAVILGFNVCMDAGVEPGKVKTIFSMIIYELLDKLKEWQTEEKKRQEGKKLDVLIRPFKFQLMEGYVFRQSNPAVIGCEVLAGTARTGSPVMKNGVEVGKLRSIQLEKENVSSVEKGKQAAFAIEGVTLGRQVDEGDILYAAVPEEDFRKLKELKDYLTPDEKSAIKEVASMMRERYPVWGV